MYGGQHRADAGHIAAYHIQGFMLFRKGPLDLRIPGPFEAKSFVRGRKIDPPGAPGRVFDLEMSIVWLCPPLTFGRYFILKIRVLTWAP